MPTRPGPILVAQPTKNRAISTTGIASVIHLRMCICSICIAAILLILGNLHDWLSMRRHVMMPGPRKGRGHENKQGENDQNAAYHGCIAGAVHQIHRLRQQVDRSEENQYRSRVEESRLHSCAPEKIVSNAKNIAQGIPHIACGCWRFLPRHPRVLRPSTNRRRCFSAAVEILVPCRECDTLLC